MGLWMHPITRGTNTTGKEEGSSHQQERVHLEGEKGGEEEEVVPNKQKQL